jgi:HEAT repeat protein
MKFRILLVVALTVFGAGASLSGNQQNRTFVNVDGPSLKAKMDTAIRLGRSNSSTPFWTAYTFDVRPGISVDAERSNFNGRTMTFSDTSIAIGTTNGITAETRNLGVFLLREPGNGNPTRVEVYNLDRKREYSGYPVYWLGRAGNEESLTFLRELINPDQSTRVSENLVVSISLHDDRRTAGILKEFIQNSTRQQIRSTAVFWLGQIGGEQSFLIDIVKNERENTEVRKEAALSIGVSKDKNGILALQRLYNEVGSRDLKEQIIFASYASPDNNESLNFLFKTAENDSDHEMRKKAIFWLGQKASQRTRETMGDSDKDSDPETEVQKQAVFAVSQRRRDESVPLLIKIAKTHQNAAVRKQAIFWLGQIDDERALGLFKEILSR